MDQSGEISRHHWKERLEISKIDEDISPQSNENLLKTFVWWVENLCPHPPPYKSLSMSKVEQKKNRGKGLLSQRTNPIFQKLGYLTILLKAHVQAAAKTLHEK